MDIIQNTTCTCRACANVRNLDLKILAHHGQFEEMWIGPMTDISGSDVILVHRMAKTEGKQVTGVQSYAMFSQQAYQAMGIQTPLLEYTTHFEHFGDMLSVSIETVGRLGPGTRYHCIHELASFRYRITDWRPFRYFSTQIQDPFDPHLGHAETYELIPTDDGVELFYRMGPLMDDHAIHYAEEEAHLINVYEAFWPEALSSLDEMVDQRT